jgi:transcriptional regulator with XRE-family HTH domain
LPRIASRSEARISTVDELGDILLHQRDVHRWTQERMAEACGVSRQQLSRYETGAAVPSWAVFKRILAVFRLQPRIELEPLDADVIAEIERQRRQPREAWLSDVTFAACMLHRLLAGLEWRATGLLAVRLMGAPAPLPELEAEVVLDDDGWPRLQRNARERMMELWDPDECFSSVPMSPDDLRRRCEAGGGRMRWASIDAWVTLRLVDGFDGPPVTVEVGEQSWDVVGVDQLSFDDPWQTRVLEQLRGTDKSDDTAGRTT